MGFFAKKKDAGSLVSEGIALLQAGKEDAGAAKLKEATEADPKHAQAWFCLGTIYSRRGELEAAVDCYSKSAKHAPPEKQALPIFNMGNALQSMEKLDQALKAFTLATRVDPKFADAWINRGRLLDDAGHHNEAIDCYDKALALTPDDLTALSNRGNSLRALNRFADAKASYESALRIDPDDPASQIGLGQCLGHLGQPEQGLQITDKVLKQVRHPPALADRAILLSLLGRHDEALASIDEAIRLGVRNVQVYNNRGEILAKLEKVDESIASFDEALKLDARYTPALFGKARVMCNTKMFGPAKATIDLYFKCSDGTDGLGEPARALIMLCRDAGVS